MSKQYEDDETEPYQGIAGYEKLVSFLSHWPTFNDGHVESVHIESASGRDGPLVTITFFLDDVQAAVQGKIHQLETTIRWYGVASFKHHHTQNLMLLVQNYMAFFEIVHHENMIETILHTQTNGSYRIFAKKIEVLEVY